MPCDFAGQATGPGRLRADLAGDAGFHQRPDRGNAGRNLAVEHPPVFTQGLAGKPEHLLSDIGIPVVKIDRGGQITYHGPGQVVIYLLLDLQRRKIKVRELVTASNRR